MQITDIKIRRIYQDNRLRALVSITLDGELAVHDIKVIEGPERLFVAMPSRKDDNGVFRDIVHPIASDVRQRIETQILDAYHEYLSTLQSRAAETEQDAASVQSSGEVQE